MKNKLYIKSKLSLLLVLITFIIITAGCSSSSTDANTVVFPSQNVSYFSHVGPFYEEKCSCHTAGGDYLDPPGIDLSTPQAVESLKNTRYLLAGVPNRSDLYRVMTIPPMIQPTMPPIEYTPATVNQQDGIKTWILEGATTTE